jgi:hypothetical protein
MAEHAASLVDEVRPRVPVRQWVLTLPYRLRYRQARDHALRRAALGVYARTLLAFHAHRADPRHPGQPDWHRDGDPTLRERPQLLLK